MTADWLEEEGMLTAEDIRREVAIDPDDDRALELTGLEPLLLALGLKAVVGIVAGFAGRASYDSWKKARTRKQLDELRAALRVKLDATDIEAVDEATIRHDLIDTLVDQGLTARQASKVVDGTLRRVRARLRTSSA